MLFDDSVKDHDGIARPGESEYSFLNRSAWPSAEQARQFLEQWFSEYPGSGKADLRSRFTSDDRRQHLGAFFELYCHALLRAQGMVVNLHPNLSTGSAAHPDFLVRTRDGSEFYVECTSVQEANETSRERSRALQIHRAINELDAPFHVYVEIEAEGMRTPPLRALRTDVGNWLKTLVPAVILAQARDDRLGSLPELTWADESGWRIRFHAIARPGGAGAKQKVQPFEDVDVYYVKPVDEVSQALKKKAERYGELDRPCVLAVNFSRHHFNEQVVTNSLFGAGGVWADDSEAASTRQVSAALVTSLLVVWAVAAYTPVLIHNPHAARVLDPAVWSGPRYRVDSLQGSITRVDGLPGWKLLRLPEGWPTAQPDS